MKRSSHVTAPLLAAAALVITTGCEKPQMQRCVDENNHVVDDSLCANQPAQAGQQPQNLNGGGGTTYYISPYRYHYYYGGWGGYDIGTPVGGGSYFPDPAHSYASRTGAITTRGGFGRSFGGGEGGEGGEGGGHGGGSGE